jgi:Mlc titration factor MtfA (ptsG expression regulator)
VWASWRGSRRPALPAGWESITETAIAHWELLDEAERADLGELMELLVRTKRWEAARGFELTDEIRVVIAAQASLLILGLGIGHYRAVSTIIVHPTTMTLRGVRPGPAAGVVTDAPLAVLGQAQHQRGPVVIAWDAASADARHPERGHNVVFHEFAHKLDMLDDLVDGTPPLADPTARERWIEVCTAEYRLLRAGGGGQLLRAYATVNPGEFFAVATEVFFDLPGELLAQKPALYGVLRDFYRQDPARREQRAANRPGGEPAG